ncbi:hypothetical protein [Methylobacterium sp. P1-11]|uniref:hypothetical protein n=1 Tax=Methylobacterium sp. P1-11 TaxID=2024616 RepID=UPI001FF05060|nr:hypothetical protein [Methylobacterium sp. P1-11]
MSGLARLGGGFAHFGVTADFTEVRRQIGKGGDELMPVFPLEGIEQERETIKAYRSILLKRRYLSEVRPFPSVRPLSERIRAAGP